MRAVSLRLGLTGLLALFLLGGLAAVPARAGNDPERDVWLTLRARKALTEDAELAPLNLGVVVRNRVATLWGPVPSAELGFKAEVILRTLDELGAVRNDLDVSDDPLPRVGLFTAPATPSLLPAQLPPALPRRPLREPTPPPGFHTGSEPPLVRPSQPAPSRPAPNLVLERPSLAPPSVESPHARMPRAPEQPDSQQQLERAVRGVIDGNPAYRNVRFGLRGQRVYLRGAGQDADVLHDLARALSRLPGLEGVVVVE